MEKSIQGIRKNLIIAKSLDNGGGSRNETPTSDTDRIKHITQSLIAELDELKQFFATKGITS